MEESTVVFDGEGRKTVTTKTTTVTPYDPNSGLVPPPGTQEEWTTTKRKVNHKTKQVETRVQRQIIMEDGKVIADSGPQVTTKTTEDQKSDESEDTKHRRLGDSEVPEKYRKEIGNQVVSEKTVTRNVMREAKEENFQYHDESLRELEGKDVHRRAVEAPNELIKIENELPQVPRGKLVHFSAKGRKFNDRDEIQEISRLDKDGLLSTETTQTNHHEEYEDDEVPDEVENKLEHESPHRQLEYGRPSYGDDYNDHRTNSSLSMSRNVDSKSYKNKSKWRDTQHVDSGDESDIIETSEVYRLSDRMKSLKTNTKSSKKNKARKDDASTQASLSDSDNEFRGRKEVIEPRISSRRSSFSVPGTCCDALTEHQHRHTAATASEKPKSRYYFGSDRALGEGEMGHITANVKTSKFAMENDRVLENKTFNEDFDRSFRDLSERNEVRRDYDRFVERSKDHTKSIKSIDRNAMLPPPVPSNEYILRPVMVDHLSSEKPARSRSFYDHQIREYESKKNSYNNTRAEPSGSYSTLPKSDPYSSSMYRSPSPVRGTWTKSNTNYNRDYTYSNRNSRANSRTNDFPDFAPLSSPMEIKSLDQSMKSRHLMSTYH